MKMKRFSSVCLQMTNVREVWKHLKNSAVYFIATAVLFCTGVPAHSVFAAEIDSEAGPMWVRTQAAIVSSVSIFSAGLTTAPNSPASPISVYIDNERISFDSEPELFNGTTMVPMRQILEQLGAEIK